MPEIVINTEKPSYFDSAGNHVDARVTQHVARGGHALYTTRLVSHTITFGSLVDRTPTASSDTAADTAEMPSSLNQDYIHTASYNIMPRGLDPAYQQ
jgi:hypothetical protein